MEGLMILPTRPRRYCDFGLLVLVSSTFEGFVRVKLIIIVIFIVIVISTVFVIEIYFLIFLLLFIFS